MKNAESRPIKFNETLFLLRGIFDDDMIFTMLVIRWFATMFSSVPNSSVNTWTTFIISVHLERATQGIDVNVIKPTTLAISLR